MDPKRFLMKHVRRKSNFFAGLLFVDVVRHSSLSANRDELARTMTALEEMIRSQVREEDPFALVRWEGDGGMLLFDIASGMNDMVLFADRIRQLVPLFNRGHGIYNHLPHHQGLTLRFVCHAGQLLNENGTPDQLTGQAINLLGKNYKSVAQPGYVVMTQDVFKELPNCLQRRCLPAMSSSELGQTHVLDGREALATVATMERTDELRKWIENNVRQHKFRELLVFAYTNELLGDFLAYQLHSLDAELKVKLLLRSWAEERNDENTFNRTSAVARNGTPRKPWLKSDLIRMKAKELDDVKHIDARFYDQPPLFSGALLVDDECPRAFIGFSKWNPTPEHGGSPYKLVHWPALMLDGRDKIQRHMIDHVESRFRNMFEKGHTYRALCDRENALRVADPAVVEKVWRRDGRYLIVCPHRRGLERPFPHMALEDVMAFRSFEKLMRSLDVKWKLQNFQAPEMAGESKLPKQTLDEIENWDGHVVYVCTRSIWPSLWDYLRGLGFPYFMEKGDGAPRFRHHTKPDWSLGSPTDGNPPAARDYGFIARFPRAAGRGMGYIAGGLRAMGTWGAAEYFADYRCIQALGAMVQANDGFAAIIESEFDMEAYRIKRSRLHIAPEIFGAD